MELIEKKKTSECVYDGRVAHLYVDTVELPDGKTGVREYLKHVGAVAVVPLTDENEVVLVKQFRYVHGKVLTEIPAGKLNGKDEDHVEAALRELREETGCTCKNLYPMGVFLTNPALMDEIVWLFLATGLSFGEQDPDEDEFINVEKVPLDECVQRILTGDCLDTDGKTQVGILKAKAMVEAGLSRFPKVN